MKRTLSYVLFMLSSFSVIPSSRADNLLVNPSLEFDGEDPFAFPDTWNLVAGWANTYATDSSNPADGTKAMRIESGLLEGYGNNYGGIQQMPVPVQAGHNYTLSAALRSNNPEGTRGYLDIIEYDANGTIIRSSWAYPALGTDWQRVSVTATMQPTTASVRTVAGVFNSGPAVVSWVDAIQLEAGTSPSAFVVVHSDADGVPDTLDPCPTDPTNTCQLTPGAAGSGNLIINPSFEGAVDLPSLPGIWSYVTNFQNDYALDSTRSRFGGHSVRMTSGFFPGYDYNYGGVQQYFIPVESGGTYTLSAYVLAENTEGLAGYLDIIEYDANGTFLESHWGYPALETGWQRIAFTQGLRADTAKVRIVAGVYNRRSPAVTWIDGVQFEKSQWPSTFVVTYPDLDVDHDGVPDSQDTCTGTAPGTVTDSHGCSIDALCPCAGSWKNHGAYVSCVAHAANNFVTAALFTPAQRSEYVAAAADSACGGR